MRIVLLLSLVLTGAAVAAGQTQAPAAKPPASAAPAQPRAQTPRRAAQAPARGGMAITVTNPAGGTLPGITVEILGASDRKGETNASGQVNFPALQAGTYRLRFSGDEVIPYEREITLRAGQIADIDVALNDAPPPRVVTVPSPATPSPTAPAAAPHGPAGQVQIASIVDLLEKDFIGRQPRRETLLSCSGNLRATMIQLNEPQSERLYAESESAYYVLAGDGAIRITGRETRLETNGFVSVPRGTAHSFTRRGNRPFVLLAMLSGEGACEQPK